MITRDALVAYVLDKVADHALEQLAPLVQQLVDQGLETLHQENQQLRDQLEARPVDDMAEEVTRLRDENEALKASARDAIKKLTFKDDRIKELEQKNATLTDHNDRLRLQISLSARYKAEDEPTNEAH